MAAAVRAARRVASIDSQAWGTAARRKAHRTGRSKTDAFAADHMERWTIVQLDRLLGPPCHAPATTPTPLPTPSADPWERTIARARAEVRNLIASGDLSHDEITAGWIETWAADLYAEEREAALRGKDVSKNRQHLVPEACPGAQPRGADDTGTTPGLRRKEGGGGCAQEKRAVLISEHASMIYDVPFRHQQALDPSALTTVTATLHAIEKAVQDCRNAGVSPDSDPAVALLTRHMATVSANRADDAVLRAACTRRLEELRRFPTLLALAIRGVEYDAVAKARFHEDGKRAMLLLASALGLGVGSYEVRAVTGTVDQSGYILLAAAGLAVMLQIGARHEGREVSYRAVSGGLEQPNRFASIRDLLKPDRFAERLACELGLSRPGGTNDLPTQLAA